MFIYSECLLKSHYTSQTNFKLMILLPQPPQSTTTPVCFFYTHLPIIKFKSQTGYKSLTTSNNKSEQLYQQTALELYKTSFSFSDLRDRSIVRQLQYHSAVFKQPLCYFMMTSNAVNSGKPKRSCKVLPLGEKAKSSWLNGKGRENADMQRSILRTSLL